MSLLVEARLDKAREYCLLAALLLVVYSTLFLRQRGTGGGPLPNGQGKPWRRSTSTSPRGKHLRLVETGGGYMHSALLGKAIRTSWDILFYLSFHGT